MKYLFFGLLLVVCYCFVVATKLIVLFIFYVIYPIVMVKLPKSIADGAMPLYSETLGFFDFLRSIFNWDTVFEVMGRSFLGPRKYTYYQYVNEGETFKVRNESIVEIRSKKDLFHDSLYLCTGERSNDLNLFNMYNGQGLGNYTKYALYSYVRPEQTDTKHIKPQISVGTETHAKILAFKRKSYRLKFEKTR